MSEASFRVGDVVRLRSGGPAMTVECLRGGGLVDCVWFSEGHKLTTFFLVATLEPASAARPEAQSAGRVQ